MHNAILTAASTVAKQITNGALNHPTLKASKDRPEMIRFLLNPEPSGGGGTAPAAPPAPPAAAPATPPAAPPQTPPAPSEPPKLSLTQAELDAKIADAIAAKQREADEKRKAKEREKAAAEGNTPELLKAEQELHGQTKAERDAAVNESQKLRMQIGVRDYITAKHPTYVLSAKYIERLVDFDAKTSPEVLTKRIEAAAEEFVKDNPRTATPPVTGTPSGGPRSAAPTAPPAGGTQQPPNGQQQQPPQRPRYMEAM